MIPASTFRHAEVLRDSDQIAAGDLILLRDISKVDNNNDACRKASVATLAKAINDPTRGNSGSIIAKRATFEETATGTSHVATIAIPAGAVIHSIKVIPRVLWAAGAAVLKVGDTADDDGYFTGVDLKATDALVGEVLETNNDALWGGKNGAYLVAATGRRGPTSSNFGMSYVAGSNIIGTVTVTTPGSTAGKTDLVVEYSIPLGVTPVVS